MKTKIFLTAAFATSLFMTSAISPCTTAVISGKCTTDGRPLLLKNRDTDELENKLMYFTDGRYKYIGLVNAGDKYGKEVWGGFNSAGFAIINSASYNLQIKDDPDNIDREGILIKKALMSCATVNDFELMLKKMKKPLGVEANFGVIDAFGGAAYFETNNFAYKKFDANDPATAPDGYLIRTNFSFDGRKDDGAGYIRFETASSIFGNAFKSNSINHEFILQNVPRCLKHSLTGIDLTENLPESISKKKMYAFRDFIPRFSTASVVLIQGIKESENPALTTMWTIMGFPLSSVAIPVWINEKNILPKMLAADTSGAAPLCNMALELKNKMFPVKRGNGEDYINLSAVMNKEGTGILQKVIPIENEIIKKGNELLTDLRSRKIEFAPIKEFYDWVDERVKSGFSRLLN